MLILIITSFICMFSALGLFIFLLSKEKRNLGGVRIGGDEIIPNDISGKDLAGAQGEIMVSNFLYLLFNRGEYLLSNLIVVDDNGDRTEIDCVLVTRKGIFCIETKSWVCDIYGSNKSEFWKQVYLEKSMKPKLHKNPVKQNENHCEFLEKSLDFEYPVDNIVIFTKTDNFRFIQSKSVFTLKSFYECYNMLENDVLSTRNYKDR